MMTPERKQTPTAQKILADRVFSFGGWWKGKCLEAARLN